MNTAPLPIRHPSTMPEWFKEFIDSDGWGWRWIGRDLKGRVMEYEKYRFGSEWEDVPTYKGWRDDDGTLGGQL